MTAQEEAIACVWCDPGTHFQGFTPIKMKDGGTRLAKLNAIQRKLNAAYQWLAMRGLPIKIIVLKPRQVGGSEFCAELCYHHSRRFNVGGFMMADIDAHTNKIWELFSAKTKKGGDSFDPFWGNKITKADSEKIELTFLDASGHKRTAMWDRATAGSSTAGAAGTRQIAWFSESARGAFRGSKVIENTLNSIPPELPNVLIIAESTAEGTGTGWHFETFKGAVTLEERMAGAVGNGWIKVFAAWHEFEEHALKETVENASFFDDEDARWEEFKDDEDAGAIRFGWTQEQIAWRRKKIVSDLGGDVSMYRRDFPSTSDEAWQSGGVKKFNATAVARMLRDAEALWDRTMKGDLMAPKLGSLFDAGHGRVVWSGERAHSWLWCAEEPRYGMRYLLVVDPASEACVTGSDDERDAHAPGVYRDSYTNSSGVTIPPELVAAVYVPGGCRWNMDILGDRVGLMAHWYGNCMVIPELNRPEILPYLQAAKCQIYRRPAPPDAENPSERRQVLGYLTNKNTRGLWVEAAVTAIREGLVWCRFLPAVREFDTFIVGPDGKAQAAASAHDDWVTNYGIGCQCMGSATMMTPPEPVHFSGGYVPERQFETFSKGSAGIG